MGKAKWTLLGLLMPILLHAQRDWTVPFGPEQVFVQNQGQFDRFAEGHTVTHAIDHGFGWRVLMTPTGAILLSQKTTPLAGPHRLAPPPTVTQTAIHQQWVNANPSLQVQGHGIRPDYFTYANPQASTDDFLHLDHVPAWQQLRYRDLYPGIDLIYEAPAQGGLKYTLLLAPHADPGAIQLRYTGTTPTLDSHGNIHLPTVLGELIDHAPTAHYTDGAQEAIPCTFHLQGSDVRFHLGTYNPARPVTIDPWTVNPALPAPFNRAFEVDTDAAGNVYVWGGGMGYNLKKYNAAGTLQWTHVSPWDTSNAWFGELLVLPAGDVFITSGSAAKIRRLTTAGATTFTNNGPFFNVDEYWSMTLNCDNTRLLIGGSRIIGLTSPQGHIFNVSMANGNQLAGSPINVAPTGMNEVRSIKRSAAGGMIFALSNNNIIALTNTLTTSFSIAGYSMPYYSPAYMAQSVQGVNAVAANSSALYTSNGATIDRRNPSTGAVLSSAPLTGGGFTGGFLGSGATNSGLDLDDCGNLYVGSTGQVIKLNSTLGFISSVPTTGAIYDVHVGPAGVVIWGGNGLVTSNTSFTACAPQTISCVVLPVELEYVRMECQGGSSSLAWSATHESPGTTYALEHSPNGAIWEQAATQPGLGPNTPQRFGLSPQQGWLYRLRITDSEGQTTYSSTLSAPECKPGAQAVIVYPTVADHAILTEVQVAQDTELELQLLNTLGQVQWQQQASAQAGAWQRRIDLDALPAGTYWLRVRDLNAGTLGAARFIKR